VQAPRFAATTFAAAQQKKTDGDALFGREDFPAARKQFEDAQSIYRQAAQEAVAMTQRRQSETEQARGAMQIARRAADQATADKYAPTLIAAGLAKERDGQTAVGRSDYDLAIRHFRDAQADYQAAAQAAAQEAKKEETRQQVAALQTSTDQSRKEMEARRDQAVKAEADRLAKNLFDAGQTKQAEATTLRVGAELCRGDQGVPGCGGAVQRSRGSGRGTRRKPGRQRQAEYALGKAARFPERPGILVGRGGRETSQCVVRPPGLQRGCRQVQLGRDALR
jgi:tetratricopeptide (TPR) repeat protein